MVVKMVLMEEVVIMMPGVEIGKPATQIMEARGGTRVPDTEEEGEEEVISTLREKKVGLEPWRNLEEFSQSSSRVTSRRDPTLCANVHTKLADLVKLAQESKHKSRSFSFPNMNRDKRAMVHEYAQHFGITTQSFDAEPQRNVIATAARDKCSLPTVSLLEAAGSARQRRPAQSNTGSSEAGGVTFTDLSKKKTEDVVDWFG